jgi:hypothetical protein
MQVLQEFGHWAQDDRMNPPDGFAVSVFWQKLSGNENAQ